MEMINLSQITPDLAKLFGDILWASLPKAYIFYAIYHQNTVFVSLLVESGVKGSVRKIHREYKFIAIQKMEKDMWGFVADCAEEIINAVDGN